MDTRIVWHARRLTLPAPQDTPRPISAPAPGSRAPHRKRFPPDAPAEQQLSRARDRRREWRLRITITEETS